MSVAEVPFQYYAEKVLHLTNAAVSVQDCNTTRKIQNITWQITSDFDLIWQHSEESGKINEHGMKLFKRKKYGLAVSHTQHFLSNPIYSQC